MEDGVVRPFAAARISTWMTFLPSMSARFTAFWLKEAVASSALLLKHPWEAWRAVFQKRALAASLASVAAQNTLKMACGARGQYSLDND